MTQLDHAAASAQLDAVNDRLRSLAYPSSHQYVFNAAARIQPSPKARQRLDELEQVLPSGPRRSLIDLGCGKGMFLLWAIERLGVERAIGIDASPQMAAACEAAARFAGAPATVLTGPPQQFRGKLQPADLVFVFHCYHYFFCGSLFGAQGVASHDWWFDYFAEITAGALVFSNSLALDEKKKSQFREVGVGDEVLAAYHPQAILEAAERRFTVTEHPLGGGRPYLVMNPRAR
jgi:SAM-dependent methyltransferase